MSRADLPPTSGNNDLTPATGARYLLERDGSPADAATTARYHAAIFTPERRFDGWAQLGDDGAVDLHVPAPPELVDRLAMFAKLLARGVPKRREDGLPAWPARVLRWRGD